MDEIFVINLGNNNVAVAVPDNNKGGQEFKSTFNGLVCESEYERFSYLMGTDAYGEANKENDFLYLSIKDGNGKEYIRCVIDEELLQAMKLEHGFLFMQLPKSFTSEYIREHLYGKDLCDIEIWMNDTEVQYNLPKYSLGGYLMCFFTEEEIEKIRNGSWDS